MKWDNNTLQKYFAIFSRNIFSSGKVRLATTVFSDSFGLGDIGLFILLSLRYFVIFK